MNIFKFFKPTFIKIIIFIALFFVPFYREVVSCFVAPCPPIWYSAIVLIMARLRNPSAFSSGYIGLILIFIVAFYLIACFISWIIQRIIRNN